MSRSSTTHKESLEDKSQREGAEQECAPLNRSSARASGNAKTSAQGDCDETRAGMGASGEEGTDAENKPKVKGSNTTRTCTKMKQCTKSRKRCKTEPKKGEEKRKEKEKEKKGWVDTPSMSIITYHEDSDSMTDSEAETENKEKENTKASCRRAT